jgi:hypothetical protein
VITKPVADMTREELRAIGDAGRLQRLQATNPELLAKARAWARAEQEKAARQRTAKPKSPSAADAAEHVWGDAVLAMVRRGAAALVAEQDRARMARSAPPAQHRRCHVVPIIRS